MMRLWGRLRNAFDAFLFDSCDPRMCSFVRIAVGVILVIYVGVWAIDAGRWFTDHGVLKSATAIELGHGEFQSLLFWLPSTDSVVISCLATLMLQCVMLLAGCWSRFQAASIYVWLVSFQHRNPLICDGEDTVLRWLVFAMIFMPLDHRYSLWRYLRSGPASTATRANAWGLRIVQFELTAIYLSTAWSKLQGESWRDGTALYYVSQMTDTFGRGWVPGFLMDSIWAIQLGTWSVLVVEFALPVLLWIPPARRYAVGLGLALHLAIETTMNLFLFEWIMIVCLLTFLAIRPKSPLSSSDKLDDTDASSSLCTSVHSVP